MKRFYYFILFVLIFIGAERSFAQMSPVVDGITVQLTVASTPVIASAGSPEVHVRLIDTGGAVGAVPGVLGDIKRTEQINTFSAFPYVHMVRSLDPNTQYFFDLVGTTSGKRVILAKASAKTGAPPALFYKWDLDFKLRSGEDVLLSGKLDTSKYTVDEIAKFDARLFVSDRTLTASYAQSGAGIVVARTEESGSTVGINSATGDYFFRLKNYGTPGKTYFYAHEIFYKTLGGAEIKEVKFSQFDGTKGNNITPKDAQDDFESRSYRLLTPFPGLSVLLNPDLCLELIEKGETHPFCSKEDPAGFNEFLNYIFRLLIGLSAVMLVLRLIYEGYRYITTDIPFIQMQAKSGIWQAFFGLLLALSAYLILNTINPKLVSNDLSLQKINLSVDDLEGDEDTYQAGITYSGGTTGLAGYSVKSAQFPAGIMCPGKAGGTGNVAEIARSFEGKVTYNQLYTDKKNVSRYPARGNPGPQDTFMLDCSSFVTTVLQCAGITPSYSYAQTSLIFKGKEKITSGIEVKNKEVFVNGKILKPGDLLGWTAADRAGTSGGHVVIYIGDGLIMEAVGGRGRSPGKSVNMPHSLETWKTKYRWVYRI